MSGQYKNFRLHSIIIMYFNCAQNKLYALILAPLSVCCYGSFQSIFSKAFLLLYSFSRVHRPVDFPAWCVIQVEPVTCKVSLVQTADPRQPCTPGDDMKDPSHGSLQLQQQLDG